MNFSNLPEYTWGVDMDKKMFKQFFPNIDKPTVIRGFYKNSDAYKTWNIDNIGKIFGNQKYHIDSCSPDIGDWKMDQVYKTIQQYVDYMKKHDKPNLYLAEFTIDGDDNVNIDKKRLDYILNAIDSKNYIDTNTYDKFVMYFGKNASTECHIHYIDNYIINQTFGSKTFYCFDYNDNDHIVNVHSIPNIILNNLPEGIGYSNGYNHADGTTTNTFMDLDFNTFNKLYKVTLNPGDSILIPPWWWHTTQGHDINCTLVEGFKRNNIKYIFNSLHLFISFFFLHSASFVFDNINIFLVYFFIMLCLFHIFNQYFPNEFLSILPYIILIIFPGMPILHNIKSKK